MCVHYVDIRTILVGGEPPKVAPLHHIHLSTHALTMVNRASTPAVCRHSEGLWDGVGVSV